MLFCEFLRKKIRGNIWHPLNTKINNFYIKINPENYKNYSKPMTFKYLTFFVFILTKTITTKLAHEWKKTSKINEIIYN